MQVFQRDLCIADLGSIGNSGTIRSLVASSASSYMFPKVVSWDSCSYCNNKTAKSKLGHYRLFSSFSEIHLLQALSGATMFCDCNPEYTQLYPVRNKRFL